MLKLYLVTDRQWLNGRKLTDDLEKAILGGVTIIQLREKILTNEEFINIAKDVKKLCQKYDIPLIINDNLEEALQAKRDGADYVGVGAIFPTETKNDATNITLDKLQEICSNIDIPVVAIGGITIDNVSKLKNINIAGVAVVSAIMKANDIITNTNQLVRMLGYD